jgi:site-specific DNA-methyltransferase (adenine-specific)
MEKNISIELWLANSLLKMKDIKDKSVDMICCDLPSEKTKCDWDKILPYKALWKQYERIIKDNGAIVLFCQQPFTSELIMSNKKLFKYCWYWVKERPINIFQIKRRAGLIVEDIAVFYKKQCTYNPQKTKHEGALRHNKVKNGCLGKLIDSNKSKVIEYVDDGTRFPTQLLYFKRDILTCNLYPTQKPLALVKYLILTYTNENDLVLDNCCGSGTTGVACSETNRNCILIEKKLETFYLAKKRIEDNIAKNKQITNQIKFTTNHKNISYDITQIRK